MNTTNEQEAAASETRVALTRVALTPENLLRVLRGELSLEEALNTRNPQPTLESIRENIEDWQKAFLHNLDDCVANRAKLVPVIASTDIVRALHYKCFDEIKKSFLVSPHQLGEEAERMSGQELVAMFSQQHFQQNTYGLHLGLYAGALLAQAGISVDEVIRLGGDPVFYCHLLYQRFSKEDVGALARKCLLELDALDLDAPRP